MKEFDQIESLENAVIWDYLRGVLNWPSEQIAYEMNWNERRLLEWVNQRATVITKLLKSDKGRVESIIKRLEKEYPLPIVEKKKDLKLSTRQVAKKYKEGFSIVELAVMFKCSLNDFRVWWNENLFEINQLFKKDLG